MTDAFTVVTGTFGVLGTRGGITSTVTAVRAFGARRHVERARGASALLSDLASLRTPPALASSPPPKKANSEAS
jgi:hypothetical protein